MFKKPLKVEVDAIDVNVNHEVHLPLSTKINIQTLIIDAKKSVITVIVIGVVAKTASEIITHIAKTKIK